MSLRRIKAGVRAFLQSLFKLEPMGRELPMPPDIIPLRSAVLCSNCDAISDDRGHCPACGSEAVQPMAIWLDKEAGVFGRVR